MGLTQCTEGGLTEEKKQQVAAKVVRHLKNGAIKGAREELRRMLENKEKIDIEKVYAASTAGAENAAKSGGKVLTQKAANVLIADAAQWGAIAVLSAATRETGRQTVYYGANTLVQTGMAGMAGAAAATNPVAWAAIVGQLAGKGTAKLLDKDENVGSLIGASGAGALTGALVGSAFGPAGTLAGFAGGSAVGASTHATGELIDWTFTQVEKRLSPQEEKEIDAERDEEQDDDVQVEGVCQHELEINPELDMNPSATGPTGCMGGCMGKA